MNKQLKLKPMPALFGRCSAWIHTLIQTYIFMIAFGDLYGCHSQWTGFIFSLELCLFAFQTSHGQAAWLGIIVGMCWDWFNISLKYFNPNLNLSILAQLSPECWLFPTSWPLANSILHYMQSIMLINWDYAVYSLVQEITCWCLDYPF